LTVAHCQSASTALAAGDTRIYAAAGYRKWIAHLHIGSLHLTKMIERAERKKEKTRIKEKSREAVGDYVVDFSASFHPSFR
jgi:hypothetical protein